MTLHFMEKQLKPVVKSLQYKDNVAFIYTKGLYHGAYKSMVLSAFCVRVNMYVYTMTNKQR